MRAKPNETIRLLDEAVALERAGGTWTQLHAAAIIGYSVAYLRRSSCPKHHEDMQGPKGKGRVIYVPSEVRTWKESLRVKVAS